MNSEKTIRVPNAVLTYYRDGLFHPKYVIEWIESYQRGAGGLVVAEFVRQVGASRLVTGTIIEPETEKKLAHLGYIEQVLTSNKPLKINGGDVLQQLKIVRMFERGGIHVKRLTLIPFQDKTEIEREGTGGTPVEINFLGKT